MRSSGLLPKSGFITDERPVMCPTGDPVMFAVGVTRGLSDESCAMNDPHVRRSARNERCVWMTPLGSAVVPDV